MNLLFAETMNGLADNETVLVDVFCLSSRSVRLPL